MHYIRMTLTLILTLSLFTPVQCSHPNLTGGMSSFNVSTTRTGGELTLTFKMQYTHEFKTRRNFTFEAGTDITDCLQHSYADTKVFLAF